MAWLPGQRFKPSPGIEIMVYGESRLKVLFNPGLGLICVWETSPLGLLYECDYGTVDRWHIQQIRVGWCQFYVNSVLLETEFVN